MLHTADRSAITEGRFDRGGQFQHVGVTVELTFTTAVRPFLAYFFLVESLEELDDVGGGADVDEQQLRQLVVRQFALGQQPATEDQYQQQQLLERPHPVTVLYVGRVDVDALPSTPTQSNYYTQHGNRTYQISSPVPHSDELGPNAVAVPVWRTTGTDIWRSNFFRT